MLGFLDMVFLLALAFFVVTRLKIELGLHGNNREHYVMNTWRDELSCFSDHHIDEQKAKRLLWAVLGVMAIKLVVALVFFGGELKI